MPHGSATQNTQPPPADVECTHEVVRHAPLNAEVRADALLHAVTPTGRFYRRNNFAIPRLDPATHRIEVRGAVRNTFDLTLDELRRLPQHTVGATMECAGNDRLAQRPLPEGEPWTGGALSTAVWRGVPLATVLERAGVTDAAVEILAEGADGAGPGAEGKKGYGRALPVPVAMHPDTLLALEMNGAPLPVEHGAPVRLVVPGWYGMASVKWVARISAITTPYEGYFQRRRYVYDAGDGTPPVPVTTMRVKSVVASPADGETVPLGRVSVRGWAWSGEAEVVKVELSTTGGDEWREARLLPAASPYAWRAWEAEWDVAEPGRYVLRARATDAAGNVQPDLPPWNVLGYGNNAVRPVVVQAR